MAMRRTKFSPGGFLGGPGDPPAKPIKPPASQGPQYLPPNPMTTPEQNEFRMQRNFGAALRFRNALRGMDNSVIPSADLLNISENPESRNPTDGGRDYATVDPQAIQRADSVINTLRPLLYPKKTVIKPSQIASNSSIKGMGKGGKIDFNFLANSF